jgi:hypothetical protein
LAGGVCVADVFGRLRSTGPGPLAVTAGRVKWALPD